MAKILVIEDDQFFRDFLNIILSSEGHEIVLREDGETGVVAAAEELPDMILCDLSMPKMTGWDVITHLKSNEATKDIPIVTLTAHDTAEDRDQAYGLGCAGYEIKPIDAERLVERVNAVLAG